MPSAGDEHQRRTYAPRMLEEDPIGQHHQIQQ